MIKKIYEIFRNRVARKATQNLGKVEINDDEIICYVDGRKIKNEVKYLYRYNLIFHNIPSKEKLYRKYGVDKPVHYIIEGVFFDKEVNIMASIKNCHVTFKNCTFTACVGIDFADHITFTNNTYKPCNYKKYRLLVPEGHLYIGTRKNKTEINKLEIINDNIEMSDNEVIPMVKASDIGKKQIPRKAKKYIIDIWLHAKEIILINTDIVNAESVEIGAETLFLNSVNISSKGMTIDADNIEACNCKMTGEIVDINTLDVNSGLTKGKLNINYDTIFINGVKTNRNESNTSECNLSLQKQRLELIESLKKIAEEKKQPLRRILKK